MNKFRVIGYLLEEPIEILEQDEVEMILIVRSEKNYENKIVINAKGELTTIIKQKAHKGIMTKIEGYIADKNQLIAKEITFNKTEENNE